jgi:competence protein ComEA
LSKTLSGLLFLLAFTIVPLAFSQDLHSQSAALQTAADLVDLNTATIGQLKTLPGMGEVYARRIVAGRPYSAKNQLVTRGIIPQAAYEKVQLLVVARHPKNK